MDEPRNLDSRVVDSDRITLTRSKELSDILVSEVYPHARTEQKAIERAMSDVARWHELGLTPEQLVSAVADLAEGGGGRVDLEGCEFVVTVEKK